MTDVGTSLTEHLGDLAVLRLEPGDVLVFTAEPGLRLDHNGVQRLMERLAKRFPDHPVLVVDGGTLGVIRRQGDG